MALTLESEQRLTSAGFVIFFTVHQTEWTAAAQNAKTYAASNFPVGAPVRCDDVAKILHPILEVNERLRQKLATDKLKQKFWVSDFADLIIDRVWATLT